MGGTSHLTASITKVIYYRSGVSPNPRGQMRPRENHIQDVYVTFLALHWTHVHCLALCDLAA